MSFIGQFKIIMNNIIKIVETLIFIRYYFKVNKFKLKGKHIMVKTQKENSVKKFVLMSALVVGFIYSFVLPFCWGNNPFDPLGTLSLLCEERKIWFWLWIIVDGGAMIANIYYLYNKYKGSNKLIKVLPVLAFISGVAIAATLGHDITSWNPKRIVHWAATGAYVVFLVASIAVYALKNIKKDKVFVKMLISVAVALLLFVGWFLILGKSGMLELVPHAVLEVILFVFNFII